MKTIKILLFILTIVVAWSISYYSYLFIAPISEGIGSVYEGIVTGDKISNKVWDYNDETLYKTKLALAQTKAIFTKDTTQVQKIEEERTQAIWIQELEALQTIEHIQMIKKSIVVFPYILSLLIGLITFFFLSSKLFQIKSYLINARAYFSN